ncbi:MAG TPA: hypothetical protein VK047_10700, partial [Zeimonas sp.]|nr:hypothetical protein [Zeimonas sp.]
LLIQTGSRDAVAGGYAIGAVLMIVAGLLAWRFGVDAERKPLEAVATPLGAVDDGSASAAAASRKRTRGR